jgi:hypothetical protein
VRGDEEGFSSCFTNVVTLSTDWTRCYKTLSPLKVEARSGLVCSQSQQVCPCCHCERWVYNTCLSKFHTRDSNPRSSALHAKTLTTTYIAPPEGRTRKDSLSKQNFREVNYARFCLVCFQHALNQLRFYFFFYTATILYIPWWDSISRPP